MWLLQMAWRDSRRNRARLVLFVSSIVLGIAALVAINSFGENLRRDIDDQAKELLGADLVISDNQRPTPPAQRLLDSLARRVPERQRASEVSFASMAVFPRTGGTRLVQIKALSGDFPFYGRIETIPANASHSFQTGQRAIVDNLLLTQFDARPGDSIRVGSVTFRIEGRVMKAPGQAGIAAAAAPTVYIPAQYLAQTGLVQLGSRVAYKFYYQLPPTTDADALAKRMQPTLDKEGLNAETVNGRKASVGEAFGNLTRFLNLVGFVALLLGCVGVASAVRIYVKEKLPSVAVLRCLGATGGQAFMIYLIQLTTMGAVGAALGAALGSAVQWLLPTVLGDFLPVRISLAVSWASVGEGVVLGVVVSVLFALLPLLAVRNVSPLNTLRATVQASDTTRDRDPLRWLVYALIAAFVVGFAYWQIRSWRESLAFAVGLLVGFLVLAGVAQLLTWLVRRFFPVSWSFLWRQSLANLYRPNNQTLSLVVSIGLGTALITTLYFVQGTLLRQVTLSGGSNQPNVVLFDIQPTQRAGAAQLTRQFALPIYEQSPIVTMRLTAINGRTAEQLRKDSTKSVPRWVFGSEYRATYRDSLVSSEKITAGTWRGSVKDTIFVSLEDRMAASARVKVGDRVTFDVQGRPIEATVGSLRAVNWQQFRSNYRVVFPTGVLEEAPQTSVLLTRVGTDRQSAQYQAALVQQFPNVSVIDLKLVLNTLDDILNKISFVIQFMALFSIVTGVLVLVGSVMLSKYQRVQESVLLRTLGASRRQVLVITALEYLFLGSLAAATGLVLSLGSSWALARFSFNTAFVPSLLPILVTFMAISALTVTIGLLNTRGLLNRSPLEVLRTEV